MKVIRLESENFKRISAVTLELRGGSFVIGGVNSSGKSSTLDAIAAALGGKDLVPAEPLRRGAKKGHATVTLDNGIVVKRTFTAKGGQLTVTAADGKRYPSPQTLLDGLVGRLSFDPLAFIDMNPSEQAETVRELAGVDFTDLDAERDKAFESRTVTNREVKRLQGVISGLPETPADAPAEIQTVGELTTELTRRREHNAGLGTVNQELEAQRAQAVDLKNRMAEHEAELARAALLLRTVTADGKALAEKVGAMVEEDESEVIDLIDGIEEVNAHVRAAAQRRELEAELADQTEKSDAFTAKIDFVDGAKDQQLAAAKLPIDGLGFTEDGVTLNDLPFEQASGAEQLRTSVAMGVSQNPELKILLIRDGSLLDETNLALVAEMAEEADAQVLIERVGKGSECSVIIEDGRVVGENITEEEDPVPPRTTVGAGTSPVDEKITGDGQPEPSPPDGNTPKVQIELGPVNMKAEDLKPSEAVESPTSASAPDDAAEPDKGQPATAGPQDHPQEPDISAEEAADTWKRFFEMISGQEQDTAVFLSDEGLPTLNNEGNACFDALKTKTLATLIDAWDTAVKPRAKKWREVLDALKSADIRERAAKQYCTALGLIADNRRGSMPWSGLAAKTLKQISGKRTVETFKKNLSGWLHEQANG